MNLTSSAVTGSPSCHRASASRWNTYSRPSLLTSQLSARSGDGDPSAFKRESPLYIMSIAIQDAESFVTHGLKVRGALVTPKTSVF